MRNRNRGVAAPMVVGAAMLALGGCSMFGGNSAPTPQTTVRSSGETAPADLQLLCASEAATRLGVDSTKVLPVSSSVSEPGVYRVDLTVDGNAAVCTVDNSGTVLSVDQSSTG